MRQMRQMRQSRMRKRMMANVPKAAVVITNPTHYAVALQYERGMEAPVCVAKGIDKVVLKISGRSPASTIFRLSRICRWRAPCMPRSSSIR
jgi:flagellar biosynthesis protein FlhB